jgi:hypothetical protein
MHFNLRNLRIKIDRVPSILTFHYSLFNYTHHLMLYFFDIKNTNFKIDEFAKSWIQTVS